MAQDASPRLSVRADAPTPRLTYVLDTLCERYGWRWAYLSSAGEAPAADMQLNYASGAGLSPSQGAAFAKTRGVAIAPQGLLTAAHGNTDCLPTWGYYRDLDCPTAEDPLAGAFYCLSLLPEYADRPRDRHGRLGAVGHPLYDRGFGRVPVADRLLSALAQDLWTAAGNGGTPPLLPEASAATSDVDAPRALTHRPPLRRVAALARGLASQFSSPGPSPRLADVRDYLLGHADPFDTFDYMHAAAAGRGLSQDVFTLVGYGTVLDPGFAAGDPAWGRFWRKLPPEVRLGIHPSYHSSERPELFAAEVRTLRTATGRPVVTSRQHFLRLRVPDTFRALLDVGIREDHSLMWADADGFRAGTARSFRWYDLRRETVTDLRLFPPHAMDVTARYYGGLSPKQAVASWAELAAECRASGTALRCIWHNSNLGPWYGWWPWRAAYEASLDMAVLPGDGGPNLSAIR